MAEPVGRARIAAEVRFASPEDWRLWREIRLRALTTDPDAFGSTAERERAFGEEVWRSRLTGADGPAVLAVVDGQPAAMGAGWAQEPGRLMVVAMWTAPEWRGHGLARAVLDQVVEWAGRHGLRVDLWVADGNDAARRLYESAGFRADGARAPLREHSPILMSRLVLSA